MKKFFTLIPLQIQGELGLYHYVCKGNIDLDIEDKISFPILTAIKANLEADEDSIVYAVITPEESAKNNLGIFKAQLEQICSKYEKQLPDVRTIEVSSDESVSTQLSIFQTLINVMSDDDEISSCMTYGTKPLSTTLMMAVRYANRIKGNALIKTVVYGKVNREGNRENWNAELYDMTALIRMDDLIGKLAASGITDPEPIIKKLLSI